jgi:hypothetical protein
MQVPLQCMRSSCCIDAEVVWASCTKVVERRSHLGTRAAAVDMVRLKAVSLADDASVWTDDRCLRAVAGVARPLVTCGTSYWTVGLSLRSSRLVCCMMSGQAEGSNIDTHPDRVAWTPHSGVQVAR